MVKAADLTGQANMDVISFPYVYGENIENLYPSVRITIERITPETAEEMLLTNIGNRDPKREPLEKAIANDEWELNGATIVFDENGNLTDGQNRLRACVRTGIPIVTIVVRGIRRSAQITMDSGVKRQLNDYLKMNGFKNDTTVGSIGRGLVYMDQFGIDGALQRTAGRDYTTKAFYDFICKNYESRIEPLLSDVMSARARTGVKSKTLGMLFDTFKKAGDENYEEFVGQLLDRKPACTAVRVLKQKLSLNKDRKNEKAPDIVIAAWFIKAWNAYMLGEEIYQLRFTRGGAHPESFPEVFLGFDE